MDASVFPEVVFFFVSFILILSESLSFCTMKSVYTNLGPKQASKYLHDCIQMIFSGHLSLTWEKVLLDETGSKNRKHMKTSNSIRKEIYNTKRTRYACSWSECMSEQRKGSTMRKNKIFADHICYKHMKLIEKRPSRRVALT